MKVAIYSGVIPSTTFIENLIKVIPNHGVVVLLFGYKKSKKEYRNQNIHVFYQPKNTFLIVLFVLFNFFLLGLSSPFKFYQLIKYYFNFGEKNLYASIHWFKRVLPVVINLPDIFHIQWGKDLSKWFFLNELFNVKIILSLRGAHINYSPLSNKKLKEEYEHLFPKVNYFHAVSQSLRYEAIKYGAERRKIKVVYSGLDLNYLKNFSKDYQRVNETFKFVSVGRFHWKKGYQYSLSALKKLIDDGLDVQYTIISRDKPSEEVLYHIFDLKIEKYVKIMHPINQNHVYETVSKSDCLLLPSVEEGIANAVLEAMAIGVVVIVSDCGGMSELVRDNENGYVFKNRKTNGLYFKMSKVCKNTNLENKSIALIAQQTVKENHGLSTLGSEMKKMYDLTMSE